MVGLKVTSPNMEATANAYLTTAQTLDLAVMSNYGLIKADQKELEQIEGAEVEFGYLTDVTMDNGQDAIPAVFQNQSEFQPFISERDDFLSQTRKSLWPIICRVNIAWDRRLVLKKRKQSFLFKDHRYTITGFVGSAEILSQRDMGYAGSGSGTLTAYGVNFT